MQDVKRYDMAVIVAPAILYNFKNYKNLIGWLKSIGVKLVYDISFGADITTWAYLKLYEENANQSIISQPCPVIVNYIEHFEPSLLQNLAPVHSPTLCAAIYLKKYQGFDGKIAMLSPCIAKETEFLDPNTQNYVNYNVTVSHLKQYLSDNKIHLEDFPHSDFDNIQSNLGYTFSRPGGLKENVDFYTNSGVWIKQTEGVEHFMEYLQEYKNRKKLNKPIPQLVDILNCIKGCNCGTGTNNDVELDDIDFETNKLKKDFLRKEQNRAEQNPLFVMFEKELNPKDFARQYEDKSALRKPIKKKGEQEIAEAIKKVYKDLGKDTWEKQHHNCNACGFHTCENFAKAVAEDRAIINSCYYFAYAALHTKLVNIEETLNVNLGKTVSKLQEIEVNQGVLKGVAKNINLIAINASIEAASAGAYGKGFTVVASEIKKLADRSKVVIGATTKTNNEIKEQIEILKSSLDELLKLDLLVTEAE